MGTSDVNIHIYDVLEVCYLNAAGHSLISSRLCCKWSFMFIFLKLCSIQSMHVSFFPFFQLDLPFSINIFFFMHEKPQHLRRCLELSVGIWARQSDTDWLLFSLGKGALTKRLFSSTSVCCNAFSSWLCALLYKHFIIYLFLLLLLLNFLTH